jgi:hypothetical protein
MFRTTSAGALAVELRQLADDLVAADPALGDFDQLHANVLVSVDMLRRTDQEHRVWAADVLARRLLDTDTELTPVSETTWQRQATRARSGYLALSVSTYVDAPPRVCACCAACTHDHAA